MSPSNPCHAVSNANKGKKLLQPQSPRGYSALARLYYLARQPKPPCYAGYSMTDFRDSIGAVTQHEL